MDRIRRYDRLDLLMPACEAMGFGVYYGRFVAATTEQQRNELAEKELRRRERRRIAYEKLLEKRKERK